jgi:hypothetical protein
LLRGSQKLCSGGAAPVKQVCDRGVDCVLLQAIHGRFGDRADRRGYPEPFAFLYVIRFEVCAVHDNRSVALPEALRNGQVYLSRVRDA